MEKRDVLKRYLAYDANVRVIVTNVTKMVSDARNIHSLSNVATASLGRVLIASTMMSSKLKDIDNRITVKLKGDGPLGSIVVCGNKSLKMKGYVANPSVNLPLKSNGKLDVSKAVGKGDLTVIKDIGLKEPYIGCSKIISGEIAEDFAYYFVTSEQTPCAIALGVNIAKDNTVDMAAGYIIEPLPDCDEKIIDIIENITTNISSITNLMLDLGNIDDVAKTISGDNNIKCIDEEYPVYECDCSSKRIERVIIALGKNEAINTLEKNNGILEISCNFCNKVYRFNKNEVENLFK